MGKAHDWRHCQNKGPRRRWYLGDQPYAYFEGPYNPARMNQHPPFRSSSSTTESKWVPNGQWVAGHVLQLTPSF